jgi:hypothetical protein
MIDQLSYFLLDPSSYFWMNIPFMVDSGVSFESICIENFKDSYLMNTLSIPLPIYYVTSFPIYVISLVVDECLVPFQMSYFVEGVDSLHSTPF